jgi:signal transduction histidine kinase
MNRVTKDDSGEERNSGNRKQAGLQSLGNDERVRILMENMFNLVYRMSPDWSVMIELEGKDFLADTVKPVENWMDKYIFREDHGTVRKAIRKALKSEELFIHEHRVIRPDGTTGWVLSRAVPIRDENGKIKEWLGVALDITEQKKWVEKLQREKIFTESIIETLHEPLLVLNSDFTIKMVNPAFLNDFQVKEEDTIGQLIYKLGNDQWDIPQLRNLLEDVLPDSNFFNDYMVEHDFEQIGKKTMLLNARQLDHVDLILLGIRDITEQKKYELELQRSKQAKEVSRVKDQFFAHMSHEIRTPLNAIVGLSYLLLEQPHNESQQTSLLTIRKASENLLRLINDILDYSKFKSGKMTLNEETVDLRKCIADVVVLYMAIKNKNIRLDVIIGKDVPDYIVADEPKLTRVLNNLVGNAVKFTEKGGVKVEVKMKRRKNSKLWLEFSITDTGIGIDEKQLNIVFDEFTQADTSTNKQYKGTGLGLSIVKMYLQIMDSEIRVESTPGKGSRFWFELPVKDITAVNDADNEPDQELKKVELIDARILVVEDDNLSRLIFCDWLEMWGILYDEAADGREAVELAKKNNYDIIFIDFHMPYMNGLEATRIIRTMKNYKSTSIYAVTADVSLAATEPVENNLFSGIIIKPFDPHKLHELINRILSDGQQGNPR